MGQQQSRSKSTGSDTSTEYDATIPDGGELGGLIRQFDWAKTGIGSIKDWPTSLTTAVNILLQSPVPIVMLWGSDGIMLYNDAYSIFAGKRHPKLLGSKVLEGWPEVADFNAHVMDEVLTKGKKLSYKDQELILYRNNVREQLWTDLNYSPVLDEDGKPAGVFAIVVETTQRILAEEKRRKAEAELSAERERLQSLFTQAPALIAILRGPKHVFEMANPIYVETVTPGRDIIGKPMLQAIPELKGQGVLEILNQVLKTGEAYVGEMQVQLDPRGTGRLHDAFFNLVYQPISSQKGGKPDGIFVHAVEITEQVKSRLHAEELNAQLQTVFDSLPDGLYIARNDRITQINQRGAEALGYENIDDVPRDLSELYRQLSIRYDTNGRELRLEDSTLGNALKGKSVEHIGVRVINPKTGKQQVLRTAGAPIRNGKGVVIGAVAINSDLTELYKLQQNVQRETVQRRLLLQKTKLLKEQNEQLMNINATKDEFIALASHQLRTPATGVKQYIAMLIQDYAGPVTPEQKEFLQRAYESNERQLYIIDDILRVAKVDMGKTLIQKQKTDLAALLRNIIDEQTDRFYSHNQKLTLGLPDKLMVPVDASQLHMAIGNIVDNAIKYSPDGKRITIRLEKINPKTVELEIRDQGVGIAEQDIEKLFTKFMRIPNARSIEVGGTGLGLYWTKRIIELHGGTITVHSKLGKGTGFVILLPTK